MQRGPTKLIILCSCMLCLLYFLVYLSGGWDWYKPVNLIKFNLSSPIPDAPPEKKKLLTIFTTFKDIPERLSIHNNTIVNWASFGDAVQPILFGDLSGKSNVTRLALANGWLALPYARTNSFGTPFLKDMYREATSHMNSHFYGFCNSDILFERGLIQTLEGVLDSLDALKYVSMTVGRRTNLDMQKLDDLFVLQDHVQLRSIAKKYGRLFSSDAEDYFFISRPEKFPWHTIKDVVIGRPGYDNYLVAQGVHGNVSVVDVTNTVLALHQTGIEGNRAGARNKDGQYNKRVIGRFNYYAGLTSSAQYESTKDFREKVYLTRRSPRKPKPKPKPSATSTTKKTSATTARPQKVTKINKKVVTQKS